MYYCNSVYLLHSQLVSATLQIILTNTKRHKLPGHGSAWCWTDREMQQQQTAAFSCRPEISTFSILLPFPHFFSLWISSIASAPYPLSLAFHAQCFPPSISCFHSSPPTFFPPLSLALSSPTPFLCSLQHAAKSPFAISPSLCARTVVSSVRAFSPGWERVCACVRASDHVSVHVLLCQGERRWRSVERE